MSENPFDSEAAVRLYVEGRIARFEPVVERVAAHLALSGRRVARALDLGCGIGASALPLRALAESVLGVDASPFMLRAAVRAHGVHYTAGRVERLPLPEQSFPLVCSTQTLAFVPWTAFFSEAYRVLEPQGDLVVYGASAELRGSPALEDWLAGPFAERFPPRPPIAPRAERELHPGLSFRGREELFDSVDLDRDALVRLLASWDSVCAAVTRGEARADQARAFVARGVDAAVPAGAVELHWSRVIRYFRRVD